MRHPTPDNPTALQDAGCRKVFVRSMNGYLTLRAAIPHAAAGQIGYDLNVVASTVHKWCRPPETDKEMASGRRSPFDRACDLISAVYRCDPTLGPQGARLIVMGIVSHLDDLESDAEQRRQPLEPVELEKKLERAEMALAEIRSELRAHRRDKAQAVKR